MQPPVIGVMGTDGSISVHFLSLPDRLTGGFSQSLENTGNLSYNDKVRFDESNIPAIALQETDSQRETGLKRETVHSGRQNLRKE